MVNSSFDEDDVNYARGKKMKYVLIRRSDLGPRRDQDGDGITMGMNRSSPLPNYFAKGHRIISIMAEISMIS